MGLFFKFKIAKIDKSITSHLRNSNWYKSNKQKEFLQLSLDDIDRNEDWVKEARKFLDVVWKNKNYRTIIEGYNLDKDDLLEFFLLMTIATMPNPIFLTGQSKLSNSLVATAMYNEIDKQLKMCLNSLGTQNEIEFDEKFGNTYAADIMTFAHRLKKVHDITYGEITLDEVYKFKN